MVSSHSIYSNLCAKELRISTYQTVSLCVQNIESIKAGNLRPMLSFLGGRWA